MRERVNEVRHNVTQAGRGLMFAGLGIAATVNDRAVKLFDELVEKGRGTRDVDSDKKVAEAPKAVRATRDLYNRTVDQVQDGFAGTLRAMGVPTRRELDELSQSIEQLTEKIQKLNAKSA